MTDKQVLEKYGSHLPDCDLCQPHTGEIPCSCGFEQALIDAGYVKRDKIELDEGKIHKIIRKVCNSDWVDDDFLNDAVTTKDLAHKIAQNPQGIIK